MGIFKNITRTLKQAAPLIGSAIGMYLGGPAGMAALGGALGGGIGSLVGGGDTEDALIAAGLGGLGGYMAQGSFNTANAVPPGRTAVGSTVSQNTGAADFAATKSIPKFVPSEDPGILSKIGTFAKENPFTTAGIAGLGLTALGGLGEEEKKAETTMQPYPEGKSRLGMGRIGNKFYNLDDEDERRQYFEDLRNRNKDKDKDDDEVVTMRSGGLNMLGQTISRGLHNEIKGRADQIGPFLDQVGDMAQEKFGVDVTTDSGLGGGLGFPSQMPRLGGIHMGSSGPATTILEGLPKSDFPDIFQAYLPMDQGEGIDQFGKPMETTGSTTVPKDPAKALELLGNAFNRGVSSGSGPFGAGASRLGGIGAIGSLFMNNGGEVEGPGTGTSDSVPARLSDGEFVLTAKAVRGAGGGDRDLGAARMYDMMSELERVA
tara:strand:+ start:40 stop:1332 length:1293 start_codon:yes stop_codon:yes gene_type:complete